MKEALPLYVVKCLTAAGFDTLEVIAEMDVSGDSGNSIEQIEQFISEEFPDDIEYARGKKFPPGHKLRIQKFVQTQKTLNRKRAFQGGPRNQSKKSRGESASQSSSTDDGLQNVGDIRRQIARWQRAQKEQKLKGLKEHKHFETTVTGTGTAVIVCKLCDKKFRLGTKKNRFLISNWTRHVIKCDGKKSNDNHKITNYVSTLSHLAFSASIGSDSSFELSPPTIKWST